jgi:hypothetical protein
MHAQQWKLDTLHKELVPNGTELHLLERHMHRFLTGMGNLDSDYDPSHYLHHPQCL